jgi:hypothetical protein
LALAAESDGQLPLGKRHDEEDTSVEVQGGSRDDESEELKRLAETLAEFQAGEQSRGVPYRLLGCRRASGTQRSTSLQHRRNLHRVTLHQQGGNIEVFLRDIDRVIELSPCGSGPNAASQSRNAGCSAAG